MKKILRSENKGKIRDDRQCFMKKYWNIPAKSGEYNPLLSLIGIHRATYLVGH